MRYIGLAVCLTFALSACSAPPPAEQVPVERAQGNAALQVKAPSVRVSAISVRVPRTLRVSEANRYYPGGDIVWREDPIGDRYAQVEAIMRAGIELGASRVNGDRPVIVDVEVTRFHALTEKARYTVGGVHAIQFNLRLLDPNTQEPLGATKFVRADFDALGGNAAIAAENRGVTQKVRITNQIARVIEEELTKPGGYRAQGTGLIGLINRIN